MTRIGSNHDVVTDENGKTKLVPKSRKARLAKLPVSARIAAAKNETGKVKPASRRLAQSLPELERSDLRTNLNR